MHTWNWQSWQGLPYLTCSLLEPWSHGFFTQQCWPRPPEVLVGALQSATSAAKVHRIKQVHGNIVLSASEAVPSVETTSNDADGPSLPEADGLLTEQPAQAVWVCSADCVPVLIADPETGHVAAVHAGWRGTAAAIVPMAIARLQAQGSQIQNLRVVLGPAIAGEQYQVSTTVAAEVGATVAQAEAQSDAEAGSNDPSWILNELSRLPNSPILSDPQPGRVRLDVRQVNVLQMERLGLKPEQMAIAPYCTYQHADHFFSYRRDRLKKVQWSGIVSNHSG